jgi:hypothetical protein
MPAILEHVPRRDAERIFGFVLRSATQILRANHDFQVTPAVEAALDRSISDICRKKVRSVQERGMTLSADAAPELFRDSVEPVLNRFCDAVRQELRGSILELPDLHRRACDLEKTARVVDASGKECRVPAVFFLDHSSSDRGFLFCSGDEYRKPANSAVAEKIPIDERLSLEAVAADWDYLWTQFGDREFCNKYWEQFVAVFMRQVIGSGETDAAARQAGIEYCAQNRLDPVPPLRFTVAYIGESR